MTPTINYELEIITDDFPDLSYLKQSYGDCPAEDAEKYRAQDKVRLAAYDAGDWYMTGVRAVATIVDSQGVTHRLTSAGMWGVESDADAKYVAEIYAEELTQIKQTIRDIAELSE